jgi:hypothetical protein
VALTGIAARVRDIRHQRPERDEGRHAGACCANSINSTVKPRHRKLGSIPLTSIDAAIESCGGVGVQDTGRAPLDPAPSHCRCTARGRLTWKS